jgi:hypothetical protein
MAKPHATLRRENARESEARAVVSKVIEESKHHFLSEIDFDPEREGEVLATASIKAFKEALDKAAVVPSS